MAQLYSRLNANLAVLLLAGCSLQDPPELAQLRNQVTQLQAKLQQQSGQRAAELAWLERQAAIAAGCDVLIPLCPDAITAPGRQATTEGIGGGASALFWLIAGLKMALAGLLMGGLWVAIRWGRLKLLMPSIQAQSSAQELVSTAHEQAAAAEMRRNRAIAETESAEIQLRATEETALKLSETLEAKRAELEKLQHSTQALRAAKAALSAFD